LQHDLSHADAIERDLNHVGGIMVKTLGIEQKYIGEEQFSKLN